MMNKEAKQEGSQIPVRKEMFCNSPVHLASSRKFSGNRRLAGGHFGGTQPELWHFGDYGLRVHGYPKQKDMGVRHFSYIVSYFGNMNGIR